MNLVSVCECEFSKRGVIASVIASVFEQSVDQYSRAEIGGQVGRHVVD